MGVRLFFGRILVVGFGLLMVVSFSGVLVVKHYCSGDLKQVSINQDVRPCCSTRSQGAGEGVRFLKGKCCENRADYCKIDHLTTVDVVSVGKLFSVNLPNFHSRWAYGVHGFDTALLSYVRPPPPLDRRIFVTDINILFQRFLI